MEKTATAQASRSGQDGGVVLSATQISLAVGVVSVCCLMAFGGGVITGMWYKANEQGASYVSLSAVSEDTATAASKADEPPPDAAVTFYDTLKGKNKYAPMNAASGTNGTTKPLPLTTSATPAAPSAKTTVASAPGDSAADTPKTLLPVGTAGNSGSVRTTATSSQSAASEPNKSTSAAPGPAPQSTKAAGASSAARATPGKPVVTPTPTLSGASALKSAVVSPGTPLLAASAKDTTSARARQALATTSGGKETPSATDPNGRRPAEGQSAAAAGRAGEGQYSVQAGSFRSPEQAERLRSQLAQKGYQARVQLFTAPNNESWYRVRVGNYSERAAAGQTAQNLTSQEQLRTVVANDQR